MSSLYEKNQTKIELIHCLMRKRCCETKTLHSASICCLIAVHEVCVVFK